MDEPTPAVPAREMPKRAMLLAAGRGTRLRPLTDTVPKCMVPVAGKPLLEHTVEWLRRYGVTDIMINVHHLGEAVSGHFGDGSRLGVNIQYSREKELLGTAGGVKNVSWFFRDAPFFLWYGDNLAKCRLDKLWESHRSQGAAGTIALHYREDPTQSGIVGFNEGGRVVRFLEKPSPDQVFSHWVSAGILALEPQVLSVIPSGTASDFGRDVLPALLERGEVLGTYLMAEDEGPWWVDTQEDLSRALSAVSGWTAAATATNLEAAAECLE